jgi:hypothetical protein
METFTGVVQIGEPLAGVTVFLDLNNDDVYNGNDKKTVTDATGHYVLEWTNYGEVFGVPHSIVADVLPDSNRVGAMDAVGYGVHLRAPIGAFADSEDSVISPLSTLVVGELGYDETMTRDAAVAEITAALAASNLPLTGQSIDLLGDYLASSDRESLRFVAGAVSATLSAAVTMVNTEQSTIDCNRATYFDPITVALDTQLTDIANGTFEFTQLTSDAQDDIEMNPANHRGFFVNTQALIDQLKALLIAEAIEFAAELVDYLSEAFVQEFQDRVTAYVAGELIGFLLPI